MSIPLIQKPEKDDINTSIIAIKRNIERINMLLGLVDNDSPDLSGLATKQELEDAITQVETDLAPVDEVTSGNMQSVTSNAVARDCLTVETYTGSTTDGGGYFQIQKCGKLVTIDVFGMSVAQYAGTVVVTQLQGGFRPSRDLRVVGFSGSGSVDNGNMIGFTISTNGNITTYPYVALQAGNSQLHAMWII